MLLARARVRRPRRPGAPPPPRAPRRRRTGGGRARRRGASGVRHLPAGGVAAPAGAARARLRDRAGRRRAAALRGRPRSAPRRRRLARALPPGVGPAPRRARHRDRPRATPPPTPTGGHMTETELPGTFREVGRRRIAAGDARSAILRRTYDAPIDDVWSACTEPERLNRWFLPVSGDLRPGGSFSLQGNA